MVLDHLKSRHGFRFACIQNFVVIKEFEKFRHFDSVGVEADIKTAIGVPICLDVVLSYLYFDTPQVNRSPISNLGYYDSSSDIELWL